MTSAVRELGARSRVVDQSPPGDDSDVSFLMQSVIDVTGRLQTTHEALQAQVAGLKEELAAANEKLRRSHDLAALGEMAAGIAHEVRNPLASILLDAELLEQGSCGMDDRTAASARIRGAALRLDTIVGDVLAFARDTTIRAAPIDVKRLLERSAESCECLFRGSGITLSVEPPKRPWLVAGDESLLVQAIGNLIRNAVEALVEDAGKARRIDIRVERRRRRGARGDVSDRLAIAIIDNGPGIAPEIVRRMFNPFFTTRRAGTGLGLAIVHRIVDAHGGDIDVVTEPGRGTSISLCFPFDPGCHP